MSRCSGFIWETFIIFQESEKKLHKKFKFPSHEFNCHEIEVSSLELNCMDRILIIEKQNLRVLCNLIMHNENQTFSHSTEVFARLLTYGTSVVVVITKDS